MDNLTHSIAGWALGQAGLKTQTRKGLAALILGANMPDIDVFLGWVPWEPLATHRGFTHSLVGGVVLMPPILFGMLWLLDRWQVSRGVEFRSGLPMRPWWLLALCYLGALTHPLLDLLTTYSVQLLSPFNGRWYHADGLFIIDVWIWLVLVLAIAWSQRRERNGGRWQRPPQIAIAVVLAYIAINLAISQRAYAAVRIWSDGRRAESIFASPPPVEFWKRGLGWLEGDCYRRSDYDPLGPRFGPVSKCSPANLNDPLLRKIVLNDNSLRNFLRWSILPQADVQRGRCELRVTIGDARYGEGRNSRLARETVVPTGAPGCRPLDNSDPSS